MIVRKPRKVQKLKAINKIEGKVEKLRIVKKKSLKIQIMKFVFIV